MQKTDTLAELGAKLISLIADAMMYSWKLFITQLSVLLATPWHAQPLLKIVIVLAIVAVIGVVVMRFIAPIVYVLSTIGAGVSYVLAMLFTIGIMAAVANWVIRTVPNSAVAFN